VSAEAGLVPDKVTLGDECYIAAQAYVTGELTTGCQCTINPFAVVLGKVTLGDHVRVGARASILGFNHNHARLDVPIHEQGLSSKGIRIGDDVWIGSGALLLDGIHVGSHCIIAAGAVVTKDVPDWSVVAGNPARTIRDRRQRTVALPSAASLARTLGELGRRAVEQLPDIIRRCEIRSGDRIGYTDIPGTRPASIRPLADAIEIAAAFGALPPGQSRPELIERLQAFQDPVNGMPVDPLAPPGPTYSPAEMNHGNSAYMVLALGYALMCLGSRFAQPLKAVQEMGAARLQMLLGRQPWHANAWAAGAWVDAVGTAAWMNRQFFGLPGPVGPLFAWLQGACNPATGLWGERRGSDGWLQAVNGFYRLTRGTYAQFDTHLPYPEAALDTILAHIRMNEGFETRNVNACNLLDVVHPLWLLSRATTHRRDEVMRFVERQLSIIPGRWVDGAGFAFAPGGPPGLQGTEMWLAILATGADLLGMGDALPYVPRGVHRLMPEGPHPANDRVGLERQRHQAATLTN
jgi:serine acetyltransferase